MSSIDNLKKTAKRQLKALRERDPGATLRDVQHALAREHGFENWIAFTAAVERRGDLETRDASGLTALDRAALDGDRATAQTLIDAGAPMTLPAAIALERSEDTERLLRRNPNALRAGYTWGTLIVLAAAHAPGRVIETLLRHGASANAKDGVEHVTPLHAAARHGNLEAVRVLLAYGADVRERDGRHCQTPAEWAHRLGHTDARDLILQSGRVDIFDAVTLDRPDLIPGILDRDPGALRRPFLRYARCGEGDDPSRPTPTIAPIDWAVETNKREAALLLADLHRRGVRKVLDPVATFLRSACWDHHVHGKGDHRMYDRAAQRLLAHHPEIARHDLYTAIVCGEIDEVRRILGERPDAARIRGGARHWTPLLYLCYTRFTHEPAVRHAEAIARLLLDHGADPNDFYMAGDSQYTPLVGVAGEGEQDAPRQPWAEAVYALLLERGAGPYDIQVLYDTHFSTDMRWWLQLTYDYSVAHGMKADWDDPAWSMLDMGGYGPGSYFVLARAIVKDNLPLVEWALAHGADPAIMTSSHPKFRARRTLYDEAVLYGRTEMAALLKRHGGVSAPGDVKPEEAFISACMRLDAAEADALLLAHPGLRQSRHALFEAAKRDRADVLAFLLERGMPLEAADRSNTRTLHHAAGANALKAIALLVARGAEIDPRETNYGATPIGWAAHGDHVEAIDLLSRYSRNIWTLTFRGYVDRVRDILAEQPELAREVSPQSVTPLWWLPDDEEKAMVLADLLIAAGADPALMTEGQTAADWARTRGMFDVARRLESR